MSTFLRDDATFAALTSGNISGTTTNDNAAAGIVGEYIELNIPIGSAVSLSNSIVSNVTSINLTAGDWDVDGVVNFNPGATTLTVFFYGALSLVSATTDSTNGRFYEFSYISAGQNIQNVVSAPITSKRFSLASTTTIFLVALVGFSVSTMAAYGHIRARRMR